MSLDAQYLLAYDCLPYAKPTPMEKDIEFLENEYGGKVEYLTSDTLFWDKPKYTLHEDDLKKLKADQIMERKDCELWVIIK